MIGQIVPFPPGTPTLGDVTIAVQDFQTGTTTGNTAHTSATLTGLTPKGAIYFVTRQLVADEPAETPTALMGLTFLAGSGGRHFRTINVDNSANTSVQRVYANFSQHIIWNSNGSATPSTGTPTLVSGGVNLNLTTADASYRCFYMAFAGADLATQAGTINLGTGTSAISVSMASRPDVVIFGGTCQGNDNSVDLFWTYSLGVATSDGTQRCIMAAETNALATSAPWQAILTNRANGQIDVATGALSYGVTASNFNSGGFDVTPSANAGSDRLHYLALDLGGRRCKIVDFTTPTLTGNFSITGAGFTPSSALVFLSNLEAVDPTFPLTSSDLMSGLSLCAVADEAWSMCSRVNSGEATTDTASMVKSGLLGASATSCSAFQASFVSWDSDGATFNATAVQGTGKKGFILFVQ